MRTVKLRSPLVRERELKMPLLLRSLFSDFFFFFGARIFLFILHMLIMKNIETFPFMFLFSSLKTAEILPHFSCSKGG